MLQKIKIALLRVRQKRDIKRDQIKLWYK